MSLPYGFQRDSIPASYVPISWQDRLERIPSDYGRPENWKSDPTKPDYHDVEATKKWEGAHQDPHDLDYLLNRESAPF